MVLNYRILLALTSGKGETTDKDKKWTLAVSIQDNGPVFHVPLQLDTYKVGLGVSYSKVYKSVYNEEDYVTKKLIKVIY